MGTGNQYPGERVDTLPIRYFAKKTNTPIAHIARDILGVSHNTLHTWLGKGKIPKSMMDKFEANRPAMNGHAVLGPPRDLPVRVGPPQVIAPQLEEQLVIVKTRSQEEFDLVTKVLSKMGINWGETTGLT